MDPKLKEETSWKQGTPDPVKTYGNVGLVPEHEVIDITHKPHEHYFVVRSSQDIGCRDCYNVWNGLAPYAKVEDGKLASISVPFKTPIDNPKA